MEFEVLPWDFFSITNNSKESKIKTQRIRQIRSFLIAFYKIYVTTIDFNGQLLIGFHLVLHYGYPVFFQTKYRRDCKSKTSSENLCPSRPWQIYYDFNFNEVQYSELISLFSSLQCFRKFSLELVTTLGISIKIKLKKPVFENTTGIDIFFHI